MMFDTLSFYNVSDNELLNAINDYSKLDYERYCNVKFDLFHANDYFFFKDLLKEGESSLRTNRDCLASLKCRTPCQNRHDYRLNHPPRKTRPKTTRVKAKSL